MSSKSTVDNPDLDSLLPALKYVTQRLKRSEGHILGVSLGYKEASISVFISLPPSNDIKVIFGRYLALLRERYQANDSPRAIRGGLVERGCLYRRHVSFLLTR